MSDEVLCVCGHPRNWHGSFSGICWGGEVQTENKDRTDCNCGSFRPSLPWPDSEGWYWCSYFRSGVTVELVEVYAVNGKRFFYSELYGVILGEDDRQLKNPDGPARFTKLLEPNPYTKEPSDGTHA